MTKLREITHGMTRRYPRRTGGTRISGAGRIPALVVVMALVVAACSGGSTNTTVAGSTDTTVAGSADTTTGAEEVVTIEVWSWEPNAQAAVDLFEAANPHIKVNLINNGAGGAQYEKLQVAFAAGSGAPDAAMVEFEQLPQYVLPGYLIPLDDLGAAEVIGDFADNVANQVIINGKIYGIPLDGAPMALGYREDLFEEAGIAELPETWDQFAASAATFKAKFPDAFITNSPISDSLFLQMLWQAGETPITIDGESITIDFTTDTANEVLSYWTDLAQEDLVGTIPAWGPEWNQAFASGTFGGWLMAAWGPVIIEPNAEDTSGLWRVSRMPSEDGTRRSAEWGGSSYAVTAQSQNAEAAAEFVIWINHEPEAYLGMFAENGSFPVLKEFAEDEEFLATPMEFFGGQGINTIFAEEVQAVPSGWQWSPFQGTVGQVVSEQTLAAQDGSISVAEALQNIEDELVTYARDQGFTVTN